MSETPNMEHDTVTADTPEVQHIHDRMNGLASVDTAIEMVKAMREPKTGFEAHYSAVPTEHVDGVPNSATFWQCLDHRSRTFSIAVYRDSATGSGYVSVFDSEGQTETKTFDTVDEATEHAYGLADSMT